MSNTRDPIRVGLIRCDTHGMWFGPQIMDHDPLIFERATTETVDENIPHTWMRRGIHYFFYTYYWRPALMTAPRVDGFVLTKLWDENRNVAETAARVFHNKVQVCDRFEQVSDDVDVVLIADCNGDGSDHLTLATPGLVKGVPTFIDKPFAHCYRDVLAIQSLAARHGAPLLSLSMLQTNPAAARFARRLEEVGKVSFGDVSCYAMHPAALIHAISIAHHVFGTGIETVRALKTPRHTTLHLDYGERPDRPIHGVAIHCGVSRFRFTEMFATAYGPEGGIQGLMLDDFNAAEGSAVILQLVRDMVRTGRPSPLGEEMATAIAVMEAAQLAEAEGRAVSVAEIMHNARTSVPPGGTT